MYFFISLFIIKKTTQRAVHLRGNTVYTVWVIFMIYV